MPIERATQFKPTCIPNVKTEQEALNEEKFIPASIACN